MTSKYRPADMINESSIITRIIKAQDILTGSNYNWCSSNCSYGSCCGLFNCHIM